MKRSPMPRRSKPMRQKGHKTLREERALKGFREQIIYRAQGLCEANTPACPDGQHPGGHCHHLAPSDRDRGLHNPDRGLYVCPAGHDFIHREPVLSYEMGWLIRDTGSAA